MRFLALLTLVCFGPQAWCQVSTPPTKEAKSDVGSSARSNQPLIKDPFQFEFEMRGSGGMEMMTDGSGGMDMMMGVGEYGSGSEDYEAGMDGMMMDSMSNSRDQIFRLGLQRAIAALQKAKTEQEKQVLQGFVRKALSERYDRMISSRQEDLNKLKKKIAKLESDLKRREAAKDRVIQLQLQSVQLAAEGLLELNELRAVPGGNGFGGSMRSSMGMDEEYGSGN